MSINVVVVVVFVHVQYFQLIQSVEGILVEANEFVVVQLQAAHRWGSFEHRFTNGCQRIVRQVPRIIRFNFGVVIGVARRQKQKRKMYLADVNE